MPHGLDALSDPTRRRILEMLAERELSAGEIASGFTMSAPAISQHLKVLKASGLVKVRVQGQHRIHSLNVSGFDEIESWLHRTRGMWSQRLDALERELLSEANQPPSNKPHEHS